jgi:hypothetical protein
MIKDGKLTSLGLSWETWNKLNELCDEFQLNRSQIIKLLIDILYEMYTVGQKIDRSLSKNEPLSIQSDGYGITLSTHDIKDISETIQRAINKLENGIVIVPPVKKKRLRIARKRVA